MKFTLHRNTFGDVVATSCWTKTYQKIILHLWQGVRTQLTHLRHCKELDNCVYIHWILFSVHS